LAWRFSESDEQGSNSGVLSFDRPFALTLARRYLGTDTTLFATGPAQDVGKAGSSPSESILLIELRQQNEDGVWLRLRLQTRAEGEARLEVAELPGLDLRAPELSWANALELLAALRHAMQVNGNERWELALESEGGLAQALERIAEHPFEGVALSMRDDALCLEASLSRWWMRLLAWSSNRAVLIGAALLLLGLHFLQLPSVVMELAVLAFIVYFLLGFFGYPRLASQAAKATLKLGPEKLVCEGQGLSLAWPRASMGMVVQRWSQVNLESLQLQELHGKSRGRGVVVLRRGEGELLEPIVALRDAARADWTAQVVATRYGIPLSKVQLVDPNRAWLNPRRADESEPSEQNWRFTERNGQRLEIDPTSWSQPKRALRPGVLQFSIGTERGPVCYVGPRDESSISEIAAISAERREREKGKVYGLKVFEMKRLWHAVQPWADKQRLEQMHSRADLRRKQQVLARFPGDWTIFIQGRLLRLSAPASYRNVVLGSMLLWGVPLALFVLGRAFELWELSQGMQALVGTLATFLLLGLGTVFYLRYEPRRRYLIAPDFIHIQRLGRMHRPEQVDSMGAWVRLENLDGRWSWKMEDAEQAQLMASTIAAWCGLEEPAA
jgi:hypothetical protein